MRAINGRSAASWVKTSICAEGLNANLCHGDDVVLDRAHWDSGLLSNNV